MTGHLLPDKFQEGIIASGLELTELDFLLICHRYQRSTDGKINYNDFCVRMEAHDTGIPADGQEIFEGKRSTLAFVKPAEMPAGTDPATGTLQLRMSKAGIDTAKLLLKLQNTVARRRVRVLEFFRDHDKLRKGFVTNDKFLTSLTQMGLLLNPGEIANLVERFTLVGTERTTRDINYVEFCEWLDSAFTRPNLEATPRAPAPEWNVNEEDPIYMSEGDARALEALMQRLAQAVASRGVILKPPFQSHDKGHTGICFFFF